MKKYEKNNEQIGDNKESTYIMKKIRYVTATLYEAYSFEKHRIATSNERYVLHKKKTRRQTR